MLGNIRALPSAPATTGVDVDAEEEEEERVANTAPSTVNKARGIHPTAAAAVASPCCSCRASADKTASAPIRGAARLPPEEEEEDDDPSLIIIMIFLNTQTRIAGAEEGANSSKGTRRAIAGGNGRHTVPALGAATGKENASEDAEVTAAMQALRNADAAKGEWRRREAASRREGRMRD